MFSNNYGQQSHMHPGGGTSNGMNYNPLINATALDFDAPYNYSQNSQASNTHQRLDELEKRQRQTDTHITDCVSRLNRIENSIERLNREIQGGANSSQTQRQRETAAELERLSLNLDEVVSHVEDVKTGVKALTLAMQPIARTFIIKQTDKLTKRDREAISDVLETSDDEEGPE